MRILPLLGLAMLLTTTLDAQDKLKDGTSLTWDKEIAVDHDSLMADTVMVPALTVPVYEASASQVTALLDKVLPGATFKKQGKVLKAPGVIFPSASSTPVDMVAKVAEDKKKGTTALSLATLKNGVPVDEAALVPAMHDLGVKLNKAVVQKQLDDWKKQLEKASGKTADASKTQDKAREKLDKSQAKLQKIAKEKSKLQNDHAVLQKEIDLLNQKWTLSQSPKDLKKLTQARSDITKNESKMADVLKDEADAQKDIAKNRADLPDAVQDKQEKAATQAEVQRTVDALQRKLENIR